ncbi:MAG TPA: nucleotidyltransferase domain-containing protein [Anaerolineales bacterium]|nr:nucleotidyltransferase domain-containing protein [Anaerolineales bacterium]
MSLQTVHLDLPEEKLVAYRRSALKRQKARLARIQPRLARAWEVARRAAQLLREQFQAKRVVVFGSLLHEKCFTEWSDIDIAVWGLSPEQTFRAMGAVMELDRAFEINLVDVGACPPSLLAAIEQEGKEL